MKKVILIGVLVFGFNLINAQSLLPLYKADVYAQLAFTKDFVVQPKLFSVKLKDLTANTITKYKRKDQILPSENVLAIDEKWYSLIPEKKNSCQKMTLFLHQFDAALQTDNKSPYSLECEEQIGELKMFGPAVINTSVCFGTKIFKSENNKYIAGLVSKTYYPGVGNEEYISYSAEGDYAGVSEVCHFAVWDPKLNLVFKGSYDFNIKRGYIRELSAFVGNNGDLFLVVYARQEYAGTGNRIIIVKIKKGSVVEERVEVNLDKFNSVYTKPFFKENKIVFTGFIEEESARFMQINGVYFASVDLLKMKVTEKNISLFDSAQMLAINDLPLQAVPNKLWPKDEENNNSRYLSFKFEHSMELSDEEEIFVSFQYIYLPGGDRNLNKTSTVLVLRITDKGKKIGDLWKFGAAVEKVNMSCARLIKVGEKVILVYSDYSDPVIKKETTESISVADFVFGPSPYLHTRPSIITKYAVLSGSSGFQPRAKEMKGLQIDKKKYLFVNFYFEKTPDSNEYIATFISEKDAVKRYAYPEFTFCKINAKIFEE